jgi:Zn-dependent peptidase ImmA (M78 family)/transcriptional regulator with XRE-family HTH domain
MSDKAFITPAVFKWARESARMSLESAASKVDVDVSKLVEWERGESLPTIRQAELLAKAYRRPFALLFLPEIPNDFQPLQDFRRKNSKELGTAATFIIRDIRQKQSWIKALYEENNYNRLDFVGRFNRRNSVAQVARDILRVLDIHPSQYETDNPIKEWIAKAESKGIFISRTSFVHSKLTLDSEEMQGFVIADEIAPFVFINSDDWNAPQLFTLVHELAHIWIAESGISNDIQLEIKNRDKYHPVELFCNQVAAHALMPDEVMKDIPSSVFSSAEKIFAASRKLGVSSASLLVRGLQMQIISTDKYHKLKKEVDARFEEFVQKEQSKKDLQQRKGGPDYYLLLVNKNGQLFTQVVMDAYYGGMIMPTEASNLLNTQVKNFDKLQAFLPK